MFDPKRSVVIVNPAAGGGIVARNWDSYDMLLRSAIGETQVLKTAAQGDGIRLAKRAVEEGATTLFSFGGDGTHNEVVNGILSASSDQHVTLGILHAGTGGDFRKVLAENGKLNSVLARLPNAAATPIDAIQVDYVNDDGKPERRYCINIACAGLAGVVDRNVNASSKRLGGTITFLAATLRAVAKYRPSHLNVSIDGVQQHAEAVTNIVIANGRYAGGGMLLAPRARLADNLLDIHIIDDAPLLKNLRLTQNLCGLSH